MPMFYDKILQKQTLSTEKLTLLYEKAACKMLLKLTSGKVSKELKTPPEKVCVIRT